MISETEQQLFNLIKTSAENHAAVSSKKGGSSMEQKMIVGTMILLFLKKLIVPIIYRLHCKIKKGLKLSRSLL